MKNNVIIRKQKLCIKTSSEQLAFRIRKQVDDILQYDLLDVYDQVFNSLAFEDADNIFINKISLNLGSCRQEELEEKLPILVKNALIRYLHHPGREEEINYKIQATNASQNIRTALLYYLEHGIYPWWFKDALYKRPQAIINELKADSLPKLLKQVISLQANKTAATAAAIRQRFIQLLSIQALHETLGLLINLQEYEADKALLQSWQDAQVLQEIASLFSITGSEVKKHWIDLLLKNEASTGEQLAIAFFSQLMSRLGAIQHPVKATDIPPELFTALKKATASTGDNVSLLSHENTLSNQSAELAADGIYIANAGLVILHPFLQQLFDGTGLLDNDSHFINESAACRATVMLNYLQNSDTNYDEHLMAFNKILCGLNIENTIPGDIELTTNDIQECDILLNIIVRYWEALKGASATAVQETFFKRNGKLSFRNNHWLLQVEKQAADILIERIPWSISTIKLPWLQHILYTEW